MKVFAVIVSSLLLAAVASAAPGIMDNKVNSEEPQSLVMKMIGNCAESGDLTTCLAIKGITALNRAARAQNLELFPGVSFVRDQDAPVRAGKSLSENEIIASLPNESQDKNGRLFDLALESVSNFFGSHNIQVKFPEDTTQEVARAIEEGRGKIKKIAGPLLLAVGAKLVALIPLFLGGLVLLATKALIVAKIAFVLAAVLGLQKLGGSGGSGFNLLSKLGGGIGGAGAGASQGWANPSQGWSSGSGATQGWSSGSSNSYPYARSYDAQDMAYSAQAPAQTQ